MQRTGAGKWNRAVVLTVLGWCATAAFLEQRPPNIVDKDVTAMTARPGQTLLVPCTADPGYPDDFTLLYWLANKTFISRLYSDGRVKETLERTVLRDNATLIQVSLKFAKVLPEDFSTNYTCVVNSACGLDMKKLTIRRKKLHKRRLPRKRALTGVL